jgi:hypothetical protein
MLGKLIRIALALLVVHAAWRVGSAYWTFYQFEDRLSEIAQFGDQKSEPQLCGQAMEAAASLRVPIERDGLNLRRGDNSPFNCGKGYQQAARASRGGAQKLGFEGVYHQEVLVAPGYTRHFTFNPRVEVWARVF